MPPQWTILIAEEPNTNVDGRPNLLTITILISLSPSTAFQSVSYTLKLS